MEEMPIKELNMMLKKSPETGKWRVCKLDDNKPFEEADADTVSRVFKSVVFFLNLTGG